MDFGNTTFCVGCVGVFDMILTSLLVRAMDTGKIVSEFFNYTLKNAR